MPTTVSSHSGAGRLSLMSCVSESSPPQDSVPEYETEKIVSTKRKFWNPRKWFKRKCNKGSEESPPVNEEPKETLRSRSTSELSVSEDQTRRRSGTPMHPGLSVSHDSIFHSPQSGSELELDAAQSSSSLSISHQPTQHDIRLQTELSERLRLRRNRGDTSEDDEGLPRSPCNSPTTTDSPLDKTNIKDHPTKSHSTCSDGSLLSMGSSEMDEDSSFGQHSRHSSKLSLHEKRTSEPEMECEWGLNQSSAPLNHSAAHHKVSIRPKRTHGAPRRRRVTGTALPTTPEVNEDSSVRSLTPDSTKRETVTELYTSMSQHSKQISDAKLKCSSLPPGLAGPGADGSKLSRSRSNAGSKSQDPFTTLEEEETDGKKSESSFFGRIFPRRSGKKKKSKEEKTTTVSVNSTTNTYISKVDSSYSSININYESFDNKMITVDNNLAIRPNALRSGPVTRQRMQPIDIPESPHLPRHEDQSTSPLQAELENHFKNKMSTSPIKIKENSTPEPSSPLQFSMSPPKTETRQYTKFSSSRFIESSKVEESKSKVRIAGLSSLQQKVLCLNDEEGENSFKSLTNLPTDYEKPVKPITKSHSFKTSKNSYNEKSSRFTSTAISEFKLTNFKSEEIEKEDSSLIFKSISLDSVKNPDEKIVESVNEAKVESKDSVTVNIPTEKKEVEENNITITGPSHKAIVNIGSSESHTVKKQVEKEQQISVTKIEVKQETKTSDYFVQLNKVEAQTTTKTEEVKEVELIIPNPDKPRKFSNDNIEVIKKEEAEKPPISKPNPLVTITPMGQPQNRFYKKHSESMKRSVISVNEKPMLKVKSNSFDCPKSGEISPNSNKSSQNSLDKIETKSQENLSENVVLRRKSLIRPKQDEEPELMKVFARRSLKLKDSDSEVISQQVILMVQDNDTTNKSRDSDKENLSDSSPMEERKNSIKEIPKPKDIKIKEPLIETKFVETTEVTLRKPINNKLTGYQRTVSLHPAKTDSKILKQISVVDRPKTDAWYLNKNQSDKEPIVDSSEIISNISEKSDIIEFSVNPKNFTQRKAEWEKRAQESIRKTVP